MSKPQKSFTKGEKNSEKNSDQKTKLKISREIVKRHLGNEKDNITKGDFKNLKIDLSLPKEKAPEPLPIERIKERPRDVEKDKTIIAPWNLIDP